MSADLSPRAAAAAAHVTALEAELARLRADIAPTLERIATIERSLDALELATHPQQLGFAAIVLPPGKLRALTTMGEELLREALVCASGFNPTPLGIARNAVSRGELKSASALAKGERPLLREVSKSKGEVVYALTVDGETVAKGLPVKGGA